VNANNYKYLKLQCYVCEGSDHISIDCPDFKTTFEGNIKTYFEKTRNQSKGGLPSIDSFIDDIETTLGQGNVSLTQNQNNNENSSGFHLEMADRSGHSAVVAIQPALEYGGSGEKAASKTLLIN
jgi:hypothetical protein